MGFSPPVLYPIGLTETSAFARRRQPLARAAPPRSRARRAARCPRGWAASSPRAAARGAGRGAAARRRRRALRASEWLDAASSTLTRHAAAPSPAVSAGAAGGVIALLLAAYYLRVVRAERSRPSGARERARGRRVPSDGLEAGRASARPPRPRPAPPAPPARPSGRAARPRGRGWGGRDGAPRASPPPRRLPARRTYPRPLAAAPLVRPQVLAEEEGNAEMRRLRLLVADGAREYLLTQYKWLTLWAATMVSCWLRSLARSLVAARGRRGYLRFDAAVAAAVALCSPPARRLHHVPRLSPSLAPHTHHHHPRSSCCSPCCCARTRTRTTAS